MNKDILEKKYKHKDYRRAFNFRAYELENGNQNDEDKYYHLEGKAVSFDDETVLFKSQGIEYKEIIDRHAFDNADTSNVFLKFNHGDTFIAPARTKNGTLELDVREDGVYIKAKMLKELSSSKELYTAIREGLIDKMSFAFTIAEESFNKETNTWTVRAIDKVYDVAPVEIPAYENTYINARRLEDVEAFENRVEALEREKMLSYLEGLLN